MKSLKIHAQPDDVTCGPSCLASLYDYFGDPCDLSTLVDEIRTMPNGGTLAVFLGIHALRRGYEATIFTYNLSIFDPSWFGDDSVNLAAKLRAQSAAKPRPELVAATAGYLEFLSLGGRITMADLSAALIHQFLDRGIPILTGLSATWLYRNKREMPETESDDDVRGEPSGHFVILTEFLPGTRELRVADPYADNPMAPDQIYTVDQDRLLASILLGVLTYDANLLVIEPRSGT